MAGRLIGLQMWKWKGFSGEGLSPTNDFGSSKAYFSLTLLENYFENYTPGTFALAQL